MEFLSLSRHSAFRSIKFNSRIHAENENNCKTYIYSITSNKITNIYIYILVNLLERPITPCIKDTCVSLGLNFSVRFQLMLKNNRSRTKARINGRTGGQCPRASYAAGTIQRFVRSLRSGEYTLSTSVIRGIPTR